MSNSKYDTLCNARQEDAEKIVSRLKGYEICEPMATPGFSAVDNTLAGLVGIRRQKKE